MPAVKPGPHFLSYLVYDAPVNEATQKVRERFDMDEETGYPRAYNWRSMARLGNEYKYEDPFLKFAPLKDEEFISQRYFLYLLATVTGAATHYWFCGQRRIPFWSKLYLPIAYTSAFCWFAGWAQKKTLHRYNLKNAILIDYTRKHPERFGTIHRPKLRETLLRWEPNR